MPSPALEVEDLVNVYLRRGQVRAVLFTLAGFAIAVRSLGET